MKKPSLSIAIIGATGLVGRTLLSLLHEKKFAAAHIFLVASDQSHGKVISIPQGDYTISALSTFDFTKTQLAFFCVGSSLAAQYIPIAIAAGNQVIDKSVHYRTDPNVPLIVPEVNITALANYRDSRIIANPNCSTIPIAVGLKPLYDAVGLTQINIATYQSVSGTGIDALAELTQQTKQVLASEPIEQRIYPHQIAFNVLPHIDDFDEMGYTREEMKLIVELKKIFADEQLAVNPTAVRVPTFYGHAAAVHIETADYLSIPDAIKILMQSPGIKVDQGQLPYATPAHNTIGTDDVFIGRIRPSIATKNGINLWIVTDNLRKGAALNALQIATHLVENA